MREKLKRLAVGCFAVGVSAACTVLALPMNDIAVWAWVPAIPAAIGFLVAAFAFR